MSEGYYQPLKPGTWSKISHRAVLLFSLKHKNFEAFIFTYLCLHAHPQTNEAKFSYSLQKRLGELTGWDYGTIKRAIKGLVDLKLIKNMTPRKPHYLLNAEAMNKQIYLPYGFQQGLQMPANDVIELIMKELPVFAVGKTKSLKSIIEDKEIELAKKDLDYEALEESKEELKVWYDEKTERLENTMAEMKNDMAELRSWLKERLTPEQEKDLPPKLRLVTDEV